MPKVAPINPDVYIEGLIKIGRPATTEKTDNNECEISKWEMLETKPGEHAYGRNRLLREKTKVTYQQHIQMEETQQWQEQDVANPWGGRRK